MPRYELRGREPHWSVVVGWDNPLQTYFAQFWDDRLNGVGEENGEEPVLWVGCYYAEVPTVSDLQHWLGEYVEIPPDIREQLRQDRAASPAGVE